MVLKTGKHAWKSLSWWIVWPAERWQTNVDFRYVVPFHGSTKEHCVILKNVLHCDWPTPVPYFTRDAWPYSDRNILSNNTFVCAVVLVELLCFRSHRVGALCNDDRCLFVPCLTLSPERKGIASWKLAGGKPTGDPWPHLEVERSKVKVITWRRQFDACLPITRQSHRFLHQLPPGE